MWHFRRTSRAPIQELDTVAQGEVISLREMMVCIELQPPEHSPQSQGMMRRAGPESSYFNIPFLYPIYGYKMENIQHVPKKSSFVLSCPCIAGGRSDEGVDKLQEESYSTSESGTCALAQNQGAEAATEGKKLWAVPCRSGWVVCIICLAFKTCDHVSGEGWN